MAEKRMCSDEIRVYCDGSGKRYIAWVILTSKIQFNNFARIPHLKTYEETEGYAILRALIDVPDSSEVKVFSDDKSLIKALRGEVRFKDRESQLVIEKINQIAKAKNLSIKYEWIHRDQNLAGKFIQRMWRLMGYTKRKMSEIEKAIHIPRRDQHLFDTFRIEVEGLHWFGLENEHEDEEWVEDW